MKFPNNSSSIRKGTEKKYFYFCSAGLEPSKLNFGMFSKSFLKLSS